MSHRFLCNWITPKWPLRVPGTQLVNNSVWSLLALVPIDSDQAEKVHKSCSVAHWKESHRFTLLKLPLKLAFIGKLTTSLNIENQSGSFSQRPTAGWRDFQQCSQCCFIANKMLVLKLLPVKQLQLIFNSCTNKNKRCKRTFVCSSGKQKCFPVYFPVSLGRKVLLCLGNTKASGYTPPLAGGPAVFRPYMCSLKQRKIQCDNLVQVYQHDR